MGEVSPSLATNINRLAFGKGGLVLKSAIFAGQQLDKRLKVF